MSMLDKITDKQIEELIKDKEYLEKENEELKAELEKEKKLNSYIKARFVECNTCTSDKKEKCLMFSENLCEGERCNELVDLDALINKDNQHGI